MDALLEGAFGAPAARLAAVAWLLLARTAPLAFLAPWLGWRGTVALVRVAVALTLTVALLPLAATRAPELPLGWLPLMLLGVREALVGVAFAVAVSVPLYALGWSGDVLDRLAGASLGSAARGPLGALHLAAGVVLFVLLGGHRLALAAYADGLAALPLGAVDAAVGPALLGAGRLVTAALTLAAAFAAPAAVVLLVLEAGFGLMGRAAPALGGWLEAMPLRAAATIGVALLSLSALLPRLGPVFADAVEAARRLLTDL